MPSLISWRLAEITNSLLMDAPLVRGENRSFRKYEGRYSSIQIRVIQRTVVPERTSKIFQPYKVENRFSNTLPAEAAACGSGECESTLERRTVTLAASRGDRSKCRSERGASTHGSNSLHPQSFQSRPSPGHFNLQTAGAGHCSRAPASKTSLRYSNRRNSSAAGECP